MEAEEEEIFEIVDYTVVTQLEEFVSSLESLILEWKLTGCRKPHAEFAKNPTVASKSGKVTYDGYEYTLTYFCFEEADDKNDLEKNASHLLDAKHTYLTLAARELLDSRSDFIVSPITSEFGIGEHLVLAACDDYVEGNGRSSRTTLSAMTMALQATNCQLPFFLRLDYPDCPGRHQYTGVAQNSSMRTVFEAAQLRESLPEHRHLPGLVDMFKEKVNGSKCATPPVSVSMESEYVCSEHVYTMSANHGRGFFWPYFAFDTEMMRGFNTPTEWLNANTLDALLNVVEHGIPGMALTNYNKEFHTVDIDFGPPVMIRGDGYLMVDGEWKRPEVVYLQNSVSSAASGLSTMVRWSQPSEQDLKELANAKSALSVGLTERLAVGLAILAGKAASYNVSHWYIKMCQLWWVFAREIRRRWDQNEDLPFVDTSYYPNLSRCLLVQKLQFIQCCIDIHRHRKTKMCKQKYSCKYCPSENYDRQFAPSDCEEFHDALAELDEHGRRELDDVFRKPRGRFEPLFLTVTDSEGQKHKSREVQQLINYPERDLYVPRIRRRKPVTQDMVDAENPDAEDGAGEVCLMTDMEAFKAANPGCVMGDFVRWHSPRDWIVDEQGHGKAFVPKIVPESDSGRLSERMLTPGNTWLSTWNAARPVPVRDVLPDFDEAEEAEKALDWLENVGVKEMRMVLPVVFSSAIRLLVRYAEHCYPAVGDRLMDICRTLASCSKQEGIEAYKKLRDDVERLEWDIARFNAICTLLGVEPKKNTSDPEDSKREENDARIREFANQLLMTSAGRESTGTVRVEDAPDGPVSKALMELMKKNAHKGESLPKPTNKRYVLRCEAPRPGPGSRPMPQRMYVSVKHDEFRISGSFSSDITFM